VLHKQKPPKNAKNKVALFIAQPNTTTIAISQNKGLTLDFTSSTMKMIDG